MNHSVKVSKSTNIHCPHGNIFARYDNICRLPKLNLSFESKMHILINEETHTKLIATRTRSIKIQDTFHVKDHIECLHAAIVLFHGGVTKNLSTCFH